MFTFQKRLIKYSDHILLFLPSKDVTPSNDESERAKRNIKVRQKYSGYFKSDIGAIIYTTIHLIFDTAIKKIQNSFEIIRLIVKCEAATE